jgi:fructose-bisphosphate aldolase class 1
LRSYALADFWPFFGYGDLGMDRQQMIDRITTGAGFIAALDQSGGSTPKALRGYGVEDSEW